MIPIFETPQIADISGDLGEDIANHAAIVLTARECTNDCSDHCNSLVSRGRKLHFNYYLTERAEDIPPMLLFRSMARSSVEHLSAGQGIDTVSIEE